MSNPITKYKGKYRIRCEIDLRTNDYPREQKLNKQTNKMEDAGAYIDNDIYIETRYGKIYWVDRSMYEAWVGSDNGTSRIIKYNNLLKQFKNNIISKVEGESEGTFVFSEKILPEVVEAMGGIYLTKINDGAFSDRNLEYIDYDIPKIDSDKLKEIADKNNWNMHTYSNAYNSFATNVLQFESDRELRVQTRLYKLKPREYFHKIGKWNEFLEFCVSFK